MNSVTLTPQEVRVTALTGIERRIQSFDLPDKHGFDGSDGWTVDIEAACGEMAFAKLVGQYWPCSVGSFKAADIGSHIQVRTVEKDSLSLIVRPADPKDHIYVLMVGRAPTFRFAGWIRGEDARSDTFQRAPNGRPAAWFVPSSRLSTERRAA